MFCLQENFEGQNKGSQVSDIVAHENQIINTCNFYTKNSIGDDDEGEAIDMDAFVESGLLEDDSVTISPLILKIFFYISKCSNCLVMVI